MDTSTRTVATSAAILAGVLLVVHTLTLLHSTPSASTPTKTTRKGKRKKDPSQIKVYVPGLVNTGNTCFLNSTLQAMAALPSLQLYLESRKEISGHEEDSITLALYETIELLNTWHRIPTTRRLTRLIATLKKKASHVLTSHQEDAQELFQILSSHLSEEKDKMDNPTTSSLLDKIAIQSMAAGECRHPHSRHQSVSSTTLGSSISSSWHIKSSTASLSGSTSLMPANSANAMLAPGSPEAIDGAAMTASFILDQTEQAKYHRAKSPFMGLLASRVSCVDCRYTAAIRHSTFDNLSLTVPERYSCTIEECLDEFVHLDTIHDFNCRKCTVLNALKEVDQIIDNVQRRLVAKINEAVDCNGNTKDVSSAEPSLKEKSSTSSQRRGSSVTKLDDGRIRANLEQALQWKSKIEDCLQHNLEMDLTPIELTPVRSKRTTKHSMIAKPPQALCLHLNRSLITPAGTVAKNPCRVQFKRILDFTPFTTSGHLNTEPTRSMSQRTKPAIPIARTAISQTGSLCGTNAIPLNLPLIPEQPTSSWAPTASSAGTSIAREGRVRYRLEAVLIHLGSHNSGHFVTYRRVPEARITQEQRQQQEAQEQSQLGKEDVLDVVEGQLLDSALKLGSATVQDDEDEEMHLNERWWRISDEHVQLETWANVRHAEAYMLFYEKLTE